MRRVELPPAPVEQEHMAPAPTSGYFVRICRVAKLLWDRSMTDEISMTAAALSYKTLLGLIPILLVVTLVAKTLMGKDFAPFVAGFIKSLGLDAMKITPPPGADAASTGPVELGAWVEGIVTQASQIDLSTLGSVGVIVTVASAIWLMTSIEMSFNGIYRARQGRSWVRRVVLYWFVLTASPLFILAIPLLARLLQDAGDTTGLTSLLGLVKTFWDLAVLWVLLLLVYMIVPAARVRVNSAAIGSFVAAVAILALKWFLAAYFARAFGISRLYGSLGLIPVFMFWMYFVWLMVLIGLEVTAVVQTIRVRGLNAGDATREGLLSDPSLLLAVMEQACKAWARGESATRDQVAAELQVDDRVAGDVLVELVKAGFLVHSEAGTYTPARPPTVMRADEVLRAGIALCAGDESVNRSEVAGTLRRMQLEAAATMTVMKAPAQPAPRTAR